MSTRCEIKSKVVGVVREVVSIVAVSVPNGEEDAIGRPADASARGSLTNPVYEHFASCGAPTVNRVAGVISEVSSIHPLQSRYVQHHESDGITVGFVCIRSVRPPDI